MGYTYHNGKCYFVSNEKTSWCNALTSCQSRNSKLITVDSNTNSTYARNLFGLLKYLDTDESFWVILFHIQILINILM
jgi:hypothetical protein